MFSEDDLLAISALQHLIFCERQCALIHVEQLWAENRLTVEGQQLHQRADSFQHETRPGIRISRSLSLRSLEYGLAGRADVVEFYGESDDDAQYEKIVPVEYKRGQPKKDDSDRIQLCAQALCLEEMCGTEVTEGALFYGKRKRRTVVAIDDALRTGTVKAIKRLRQMIDDRETPPAVKLPKCKSCSLVELCLPSATTAQRSASRFMARQLASHAASDGPQTDEDSA